MSRPRRYIPRRKSIMRMNDAELIHYLEGQSLILNEFGMKSEFHIDEWEEYETKYELIDCPYCEGNEPECYYCGGSKYEVENKELVKYRETYECTNFIDETIYETNQSVF